MTLLRYYGFDITMATTAELLDHWQSQYPSDWIRLAVIEALYRGRYKQKSVEEILRRWHTLGQPQVNFNADFEGLIAAKIDSFEPQLLSDHLEQINRQDTPETLPLPTRGFDTYQKLRAIAQEHQPTIEPDVNDPN